MRKVVCQLILFARADVAFHNLVYSDALQTTFFFFGGASNEYDTAATAYIYCPLKDSSTLKNITMIIWASIIDYKYNGEIKETGSSFLEWVNDGRTDGDNRG